MEYSKLRISGATFSIPLPVLKASTRNILRFRYGRSIERRFGKISSSDLAKMELGHFLTRSGLTHLKVSLVISPRSFRLLV